MKKRTTLELVEQSEKVSLYSICFALDHKTEFERFLNKFEKEASLNRDYQRIIYALSIILENGALERYFRPEGKLNDSLTALPIENSSNGDYKYTATYEQDSKLYGYALDLQRFEKLLRKDIDEGIVSIEEMELTDIEDKEYWI